MKELNRIWNMYPLSHTKHKIIIKYRFWSYFLLFQENFKIFLWLIASSWINSVLKNEKEKHACVFKKAPAMFSSLCSCERNLVPYPAWNYMFKVNHRSTRTKCEMCSKLTIKTPELRQWRHSGVFIVNVKHILHFVLVFLLLTLSR